MPFFLTVISLHHWPLITPHEVHVQQAVACPPVTQRARLRSPLGTSFLGEVFRDFFLTCGRASLSNFCIASPTSQLILQPFRCFTYVTGTSPTPPSEPPMERAWQDRRFWSFISSMLLQRIGLQLGYGRMFSFRDVGRGSHVRCSAGNVQLKRFHWCYV